MMSPNTSRGSDSRQLSSQIFLGFICLLLASMSTGQLPHNFVDTLSERTEQVTSTVYLGFILATCVTGVGVAFWRRVVVPRVRDLIARAGKTEFHGERFVWDLVKDEIRKGRFVQLHLKDDWVYEGVLDKIPTMPSDPGLYLQVKRTRKLDDKGLPIFSQETEIPDFESVMYIDVSDIKRIQVLRPLEQEPEKPVKQWAPNLGLVPEVEIPLSPAEVAVDKRIADLRSHIAETRGERKA